MAKKSPQTFQKRQRERQKQLKRQEKMDRRLDRSEAKKQRQTDGESFEEIVEMDHHESDRPPSDEDE